VTDAQKLVSLFSSLFLIRYRNEDSKLANSTARLSFLFVPRRVLKNLLGHIRFVVQSILSSAERQLFARFLQDASD
jgi:hypothetical protein